MNGTEARSRVVGAMAVRIAGLLLLNLPKGDCEIPLVLMDRMIHPDGQIYYPVSQMPDAPWVPEYTGNAVLINGKLLPYLDVRPRKYRFRILNASNARFYFLSLGSGRIFRRSEPIRGCLPRPLR